MNTPTRKVLDMMNGPSTMKVVKKLAKQVQCEKYPDLRLADLLESFYWGNRPRIVTFPEKAGTWVYEALLYQAIREVDWNAVALYFLKEGEKQ